MSSIRRSLEYLEKAAAPSEPKHLEELLTHLVLSLEATLPLCERPSTVKYLMLGWWHKRAEPQLTTEAELLLDRVEGTRLHLPFSSFLYWAIENGDKVEANPYKGIVDFVTQGGRFTRFEQNVLDIFDEFGERAGFPLMHYIERQRD